VLETYEATILMDNKRMELHRAESKLKEAEIIVAEK
jgi:hypothetical protein